MTNDTVGCRAVSHACQIVEIGAYWHAGCRHARAELQVGATASKWVVLGYITYFASGLLESGSKVACWHRCCCLVLGRRRGGGSRTRAYPISARVPTASMSRDGQSPGCRGVEAVEPLSRRCRGLCRGLSRSVKADSMWVWRRGVEVCVEAVEVSRYVEALSRLSILLRPMRTRSSDIVQWQQNC